MLQAVEFYTEWSLSPTNLVFMRVQTGIYDPRQIGDKSRWYASQQQRMEYHVCGNEDMAIFHLAEKHTDAPTGLSLAFVWSCLSLQLDIVMLLLFNVILSKEDCITWLITLTGLLLILYISDVGKLRRKSYWDDCSWLYHLEFEKNEIITTIHCSYLQSTFRLVELFLKFVTYMYFWKLGFAHDGWTIAELRIRESVSYCHNATATKRTNL